MQATQGSALAGSLAATLEAIEIAKLVAGDRESLAAGREVLLDARHPALSVTGLVRNPKCRFSHERWEIERAPDLLLGEALALAGGGGASLTVPDDAFVSGLGCPRCGFEPLWKLSASLTAEELGCPHCGSGRLLRGFDLVETLTPERVPPSLLAEPLSARGLRRGEIFSVKKEGAPGRHFVLGGETAGPAVSGTSVVVAGLGNVGSFLAPHLARMEGVGSVALCDPDVYEPGQERGQDVGIEAAGRAKVEVQAERLRRIRPSLEVLAFRAPVESLPMGLLLDALVVSCLDSRIARLRLAARAWRVGSPFIDAAVGGGGSLLVRTNVYLPGNEAACFECAFDAKDYVELERVSPCDGVAPRDGVARAAWPIHGEVLAHG